MAVSLDDDGCIIARQHYLIEKYLMKSICFVTTGDIKDIATAKRALGLANPLSDLGWEVSIIMEDTEENRHRVGLECDERVQCFFLTYKSAWDEKRKKKNLLKKIKPDYVYLCAFVFRNIVHLRFKCKRLVEHSELQSSIKGVKWWRKCNFLWNEYYSLIYADGILNASHFLQQWYQKKANCFFLRNKPMLYFPYAYNQKICEVGVSPKPVDFSRNPNDILVTYLGSLTQGYSTMDIVKAVQLLHHPDMKVLLIGKGGDSSDIEDYIRNHGLQRQVFLLGYVDEEEIPSYFSVTDVFILPMNDTVKDWARCPSKLYMYLPYRKPIVTAKIGEPYEVLKDAGIYYQPGSIRSLTEALRKAIDVKSINIDATCHEWSARASLLNAWIENSFENK